MKAIGYMYPALKRSAGFSLIEVLVALLVLSIGLLGLAMLQMRGMQFNSDAYFRTQATLLAYDIMDRMRANRTAAGNGDYHLPNTADVNIKLSTYNGCKGLTGVCNCDTQVCLTTNLAIYDLGRWYEAQARLLPAPIDPSTIVRNGTQHTITLRWMERELQMTQTWVIEL